MRYQTKARTVSAKGVGARHVSNFDAHGLEERTTSNSVINHFEAILVVCIYKKIDKVLRDGTGESAEGKVSVVTPYKEQVTVIRMAFEQLCGGVGAAARLGVQINTIDGYQGQESDVIIFSTVRGSGDGGIGFLSDIRRLNVAITRAKKALYIVGRVGKLRRRKPAASSPCGGTSCRTRWTVGASWMTRILG